MICLSGIKPSDYLSNLCIHLFVAQSPFSIVVVVFWGQKNETGSPVNAVAKLTVA
jgi:hypothetical protein